MHTAARRIHTRLEKLNELGIAHRFAARGVHVYLRHTVFARPAVEVHHEDSARLQKRRVAIGVQLHVEAKERPWPVARESALCRDERSRVDEHIVVEAAQSCLCNSVNVDRRCLELAGCR